MAVASTDVNTTAATSLVITIAGGAIPNGDIVAVGLQSGDTGAGTDLTGQGFTQLTGSPIVTSNATKLWFWYKVASGEPSSYTFTETTGIRTIRGFVARITGRNTTTPINRSSTAVNNTLTASWPYTSAAYGTNTDVECDIIHFGGADTDFTFTSVSHTQPSGFTEFIDYGLGSSSTAITASFLNAVASGSNGVYTSTAACVPESREARRATFSVAFAKAAGGGGSFSATGGITPSAVLSWRANRSLGGGISPVGTVNERASRILAGSITPAAILNAVRLTAVSYVGSITPTGVVSRIPARGLSGNVTPNGTVVRRPEIRSLGGAVTMAGTVVRNMGRSFGGSITPSGQLASARVALVSLAGTIASIVGVMTSVFIPYVPPPGGAVEGMLNWFRRRHRRG